MLQKKAPPPFNLELPKTGNVFMLGTPPNFQWYVSHGLKFRGRTRCLVPVDSYSIQNVQKALTPHPMVAVNIYSPEIVTSPVTVNQRKAIPPVIVNQKVMIPGRK